MKNFFLAAFAALFVFGLSACERSTEVEVTPGEPTEVETDYEIGIPESVEDDAEATGAAMREGIGDAADAVGEAADDAAVATENAVDNVGDAADAAAEELDGDGN